MGAWYTRGMRIIARKALRDFWDNHPDARLPLQVWYAEAKHANWQSMADIKDAHRNASVLPNNRVVFNIRGNRYRLVVFVLFRRGTLYIRFVGIHDEYDRIDATSI